MPVLPRQSESECLEQQQTASKCSSGAWQTTDSDDHTQSDTDHPGNIAYCCLPSGCPNYYSDPIQLNDLADAVKVYCNNEACTQGVWMHGDCFREWESRVLAYLRSCGRARSWSEKQRAQNLWTKKGYDLAFKACDCKCGRGHLRQDLSYTPGLAQKDDDKKQRKQRKRDRLLSTGSIRDTPSLNQLTGSNCQSVGGAAIRQRTHRLSMSSTGSSGSPPSPLCTPSGHFMPQTKKNKFDFFADAEQAAAGNIFRHRTDLTAFGALPRHLQNPYHIKTEDDGPHGNDETRCFLLTNLSTQKVTSVGCVLCQATLYIYDKYPLIDGTFFLSPQRYNSDLQVIFENRLLYLNAVCMRCMDSSSMSVRCRSCNSPWLGTTLVIGTMYAYDVFAAAPCCQARLQCKQCHEVAIEVTASHPPLKYFSEYSHRIKCRHCGVEDHHFVKTLDEVFVVQKVAGAQPGIRV